MFKIGAIIVEDRNNYKSELALNYGLPILQLKYC